MTEAERRKRADKICEEVRTLVMDTNVAAVDVSVSAGVERRPNLRTGYYEAQHNGTYTMEIHINGGAQDTEEEGCGHPGLNASGRCVRCEARGRRDGIHQPPEAMVDRYRNDAQFHVLVQHLIRADTPEWVMVVLHRAANPLRTEPGGERDILVGHSEADVLDGLEALHDSLLTELGKAGIIARAIALIERPTTPVEPDLPLAADVVKVMQEYAEVHDRDGAEKAVLDVLRRASAPVEERE